jgi:hypothetical protein
MEAVKRGVQFTTLHSHSFLKLNNLTRGLLHFVIYFTNNRFDDAALFQNDTVVQKSHFGDSVESTYTLYTMVPLNTNLAWHSQYRLLKGFSQLFTLFLWVLDHGDIIGTDFDENR